MIAWMLLMSLASSDPDPQQIPALRLPGPQGTAVKFAILIDEEPAEQAWTAFLDRWRGMFDTDRDDRLSPTEAAAIPALTTPSGALILLDVKAADTDADGLANRREIAKFYRDRRVTGCQLLPARIDSAATDLSMTLWDSLDCDQDGRLSTSELSSAIQLLNRWDLNEDERLTAEELPSPTTRQSRPASAVQWLIDSNLSATDVDTLSIPVTINSLKRPQTKTSLGSASGLQLLSGSRFRLQRPGMLMTVRLAESSVQRITAAQQYLLGETCTARGIRTSLTEAQLRADPALEWLATFFVAADTDRNQELSDAELRLVVDLLAEGASAHIAVTVIDRGRNLFDLLDTDADGRLDRRELLAAGWLNTRPETDSNAPKLLESTDIPLSVVVAFHRGPVGDRFGRLRIARKLPEPAVSRPALATVPRWFSAMDRNRDQTLSPLEFFGTNEQFFRLDKNSDGVISDDEIARD